MKDCIDQITYNNFRFGSPEHDYVEIKVKPICGSKLESHLNTTKDSFDYSSEYESIGKTIDTHLTNNFDQISITNEKNACLTIL